jgi:hypothetical protein
LGAGAGAGAGAGEAFPPKILNMTVPQVGQRPLIARRPFFIVSSKASAISFFALHLTQYPSGISRLRPHMRMERPAKRRRRVYEGGLWSVNWENREEGMPAAAFLGDVRP